MDNQFASQLANLQRVASRAGGRRDAAVGDDARRHGARGRDARYGGRGRGDYDRKRRREDDDYRGGRYRDDRGRGYRDDRRTGRSYHGGRHNDRYDHRDRRRDEYGDDRREQRSQQPQVPLGELVKGVAEKYSKHVNETSQNVTQENKRRHIALLFLTIDDLPHEHIWKEWLKSSSLCTTDVKTEESTDPTSGAVNDSNDVMVSIICHAKHPERITSPWLRQRHLIRFRREEHKTESNQEGKQAETSEQLQQPPRMHTRRPEWGSIEITRAMIDLLEEGLRIGQKSGDGAKGDDAKAGRPTDEPASATDVNKSTSYRRYLSTPGDALSDNDTANGAAVQSEQDIPPVDRFIFVSESCLPVATLKEVEMALFGPRDVTKKIDDDSTTQKKNPYDKSWLNARSTPNNGYSRQLQWDEIRPSDIPTNLIWKADQWIVLNRAHGEKVASIPNCYLNNRSLWYAFRRCRASDEMYFPTALAILGIIARPPGVKEVEGLERNDSCAGDQIRRRKVTYCDWSVSAKNPASFTSKDWADVVVNARCDGCLFARKFVPLSSSEREKKNGQAAGGDGVVTVEDWLTLMRNPNKN